MKPPRRIFLSVLALLVLAGAVFALWYTRPQSLEALCSELPLDLSDCDSIQARGSIHTGQTRSIPFSFTLTRDDPVFSSLLPHFRTAASPAPWPLCFPGDLVSRCAAGRVRVGTDLPVRRPGPAPLRRHRRRGSALDSQFLRPGGALLRAADAAPFHPESGRLANRGHGASECRRPLRNQF